LIVAATCLPWLGGCSSSMKISDLWSPKSGDASSASGANSSDAKPNDPSWPKIGDQPAGPAASASETTGSVVVPPAESGQTVAAPPAKPGLLGDNSSDDLQLGKKYFRSNNYGLAEKSFRSAVEKHPRDAEAWVGLAASYDRLHRFDLADRAYQEAIRVVGPTVEILNNQGFSYMLRGDYARAHKKLQEAEAKDPANPYVAANMRLLEESYQEGKAIQ
jgi:Tfp pilus assembly protein PilF